MKLRSPLPQRKTRLEIIPLIDIMFFLLASFMLVSLSMSKMRTVKVDLPVASSSAADIKPDTIDIGVNSTGDYFFGTQQISLPELERTLADRHAKDPSVPLYISADENSRHGSVMRLHDIASRLGFTKIAHRTKKPEVCSMKPALVVITLALCALVIVQWVRESGLQRELSEMDKRIRASEAAQSDLEDKLKTWEAEIQRLTENSAAAAKKEKELQTEIARLTTELTTRDAELKNAAAAPPEDYVATMKARNEEVTKQNEAIQKANESLQKLVQERDSLVAKLNARTREWNELTERYNKLAKSR